MLERVNSLPWKGASLDRNHLPTRSDGNRQAACQQRGVPTAQLWDLGYTEIPARMEQGGHTGAAWERFKLLSSESTQGSCGHGAVTQPGTSDTVRLAHRGLPTVLLLSCAASWRVRHQKTLCLGLPHLQVASVNG